MNEKNRGDYLFSGTLSNQPPFVLATDANGNVTSVTYQGNTTLAESEIASGVTLSAQAIGENTSGTGPRGLITDSRVGADFFNHLISLQNNLLSGNVAAIEATDRTSLAQGQSIANFRLHAVTGNYLVTHAESDWGEDVCLLAIGILQKGDAAGAVRIVFDGLDLSFDATLGALEVDDPVFLFVTAADVPGGNATVVIASAGLVLGLDQGLLGLGFGDLIKRRQYLEAVGRGERAESFKCHDWSVVRRVRSCRPSSG